MSAVSRATQGRQRTRVIVLRNGVSQGGVKGWEEGTEGERKGTERGEEAAATKTGETKRRDGGADVLLMSVASLLACRRREGRCHASGQSCAALRQVMLP